MKRVDTWMKCLQPGRPVPKMTKQHLRQPSPEQELPQWWLNPPTCPGPTVIHRWYGSPLVWNRWKGERPAHSRASTPWGTSSPVRRTRKKMRSSCPGELRLVKTPSSCYCPSRALRMILCALQAHRCLNFPSWRRLSKILLFNGDTST